jgi:hypothetical protein
MNTTRRLGDIASAIKSSNAGASWLTFDIRFPNRETFDLVVTRELLKQAMFAELYHVDADEVRIFPYEPTLTVKVTIPRKTVSGGPEETDFDGVQQFVPLLDAMVPTCEEPDPEVS